MTTDIFGFPKDPGPKPDPYEADYYAWALDQATRLRHLARTGTACGEIDCTNLAGELERIARAERDAVRRSVRRVIEHKLKLSHSAAVSARSLWELAIADARGELNEKITASLQDDAMGHLPTLYAEARTLAATDLEGSGEFDRAADLPRGCPYSFADILGVRFG
jgi:hypothetical protein